MTLLDISSKTELLASIASATHVAPDAITILAAREGRIVARISTPAGVVLAKADAVAGEFDREAEAMRHLRSLGLPVSDVLHLEDGPPSVLIATWVEGHPVSTDAPATALARLGGILRTIHRQPATAPFSGHPTIAIWIESWLRSLLLWWMETGTAPADANAICESWLAACTPVLAQRQGTLILFDGRPDHFLVDQAGDLHMIDVADLMSGDPAMDLAVLELANPGLVAPVLAGYDPSSEERHAFDTLIPLYTFLRALSGAEWAARLGGDQQGSERLLVEAERRLVVAPYATLHPATS